MDFENAYDRMELQSRAPTTAGFPPALPYPGTLTLLQDLLTESSASRGRLAVVSGGQASGKTRLLNEFAETAEEGGALLLRASASRGESALRFGIVEQLFCTTRLPIGVADRIAGLLTAGGEDTTAFRAIFAVMLDLARGGPLVVTVDDVQFADPQSQQLLLYLHRRLGPARILLVVTEWNTPRPGTSAFSAELTRRPHERVLLARPGVAEVAGLITPRLGAGGAALAPLVHRLSGGNALLALALAMDLHNAGVPGGREPGVAFRHAVLECLYRCDAPLRDVAYSLAVLGDYAQADNVSRLLGITTDEVAQAVAVLTEAGLLSDGAFRHPSVPELLLETMPAEQRGAQNLAAASLLDRCGAPPTEIARQLVMGGQPPEPWAVPVLREAADQALAADRVQFAIKCLRLALSAGLTDGQRIRITAMLVRALDRLNPAAAAPHLPELLSALRRGELTGRDTAVVIRNALWNGRLTEVADLMRTANTHALLTEPGIAAELRLNQYILFGQLPESFPAREDAAGNIFARAIDALCTMWRSGPDASVIASAEQVLTNYSLGDTTVSTIAAALSIFTHGNRHDEAATWCERLIADATRRGAASWTAVFSYLRAEVALRRGDLAVARDYAEEALRRLAPEHWGVLVGYPLSVLANALTWLGEHDRAGEVMRTTVTPAPMLSTLCGIRYLQARGRHYLATERVFAAAKDFRQVGTLARERNLDVPSLVPWRTDLAEASAQLNRPAEARDLLHQQFQQRGLDGRARGAALRLLAGLGDPARRVGLLKQSVSALEAACDRYELGRALHDLSQAQRQAGDVERSRQTASRAAQEMKACHASDTGLAPVAAPEPGSPPAGRPRAAAADDRAADMTLSKAEQRVATLAAQGHSNRQIARTLYITMSTVEQHLTRVYRKLNARCREDLALLLAGPRVF
ncbi:MULTISPECIES: AAA family ATPase [unclassified Actinoplanes]|uniref:AAA family ATPase n=1 Tax=unclassified Actinoplanes TaxID=2626549 RepID=UPI00043A4BD2|nr:MULTISPECIES: helix-turn-helix transcriptional regulator [unclassified Actinoplanes]